MRKEVVIRLRPAAEGDPSVGRARERERVRKWARRTFTGYEESHAGHPLGPGMPPGSPLRLDGETHHEAWMRIIRMDPCAFCNRDVLPYTSGLCIPGGTVDHIEPKSLPVKGLGGAHAWLNLTGACERCNTKKSDRDLLEFLFIRAWGTGYHQPNQQIESTEQLRKAA